MGDHCFNGYNRQVIFKLHVMNYDVTIIIPLDSADI